MSRICSDCGCAEWMHKEPPKREADGKGCSAKDKTGKLAHANYCTMGFTTVIGGCHPLLCTHRNGHKKFCPEYKEEKEEKEEACVCFNGRSRFCTVHRE